MPGAGTQSRLTDLPAAGVLTLAEDAVAAPHYRRVGGRVLVTNDLGFHAFLEPADFADYLAGRLAEGTPLHAELQDKGFLRSRLDFRRLAEDFRRKNAFLFDAPTLHILVATLRCNHKCSYCHSSVVGMDRTDTDMSVATARRAVDFIFACPNPDIAVEFQGGEPLANWPVLKFATRYARLKNQISRRRLFLSVVTNFSLLDEEKFDFLVQERVGICTSLDGPADLHDRNRSFAGGSGHALVARWLKRFLSAGVLPDGKRAYRPSALLTTTRFSLGRAREIVDHYLSLDLPGIFIRPLSPIGFARRAWNKIGYTPAEYLDFYREALDYILELNLAGVPFHERMARTLLVKLLQRKDPNYVDLRSPSGAGLGVLAYDYDGAIYTGDEARMLAQEGLPLFKVGQVATSRYNDVLAHPLVRAAAAATLLENQPLCAQCAYKPYCGQDPAYNTRTQGSLAGQMPTNGRCETYMGLFDILFERLQDVRYRRVFESWLEP